MYTEAPLALSALKPTAVPEQLSPELVLVDPDLRRLVIEQGASDLLDLPSKGARDQAATRASAPPAAGSATRQVGRRTRLLLAALAGSALTLIGVFAGSMVSSHPARVTSSVAVARFAQVPNQSAHRVAVAKPSLKSAATSPPASEVKPPSKRQSQVSPTPAPEVRRFAWAPVAGATAYEVAFYRSNIRVYRARTRRAVVSIPEGSGGSKPTLVPGTYEWYVWPVRNGRRDQVAVVRSQIVVPARVGRKG
jgi:hypothetical protein